MLIEATGYGQCTCWLEQGHGDNCESKVLYKVGYTEVTAMCCCGDVGLMWFGRSVLWNGALVITEKEYLVTSQVC